MDVAMAPGRLIWHPRRPSRGEVVVAVGTFDGVHVGHQAILRAARELADRAAAPCVALTFEPHPRSVVQPEWEGGLLTTLDQRLELLLRYGAHACAVLHFDRQVAAMAPEAFVQEVLVEKIGAAAVVAGFNFAFGRGRRGDISTLQALGPRLGLRVRAVEPVYVDGRPASSTAARALLQQGEVGPARAVLGRSYAVRGVVVRGEGRGRQLGYPTANIEHSPEQVLPADGVYVARFHLLGDGPRDSREDHRRQGLDALAVVSRRPTFGGDRRWLEVHALDAAGDWYGRSVEVEFEERLRPIRTFSSPEELAAQIEADRRAAEAYLGRPGPRNLPGQRQEPGHL